MAYNYLDSTTLDDALQASEEYMKPFYDPLAELERVTRGKPGKIPQGKPRITEGTLAGIRRETPKQIIQQLPTGRVIVRADDSIEDYANAILTDIILPNANSGGTPYAKSKNAIKDTISTGSSFAYCFFNRTGDLFHADYRRIYCRDIYFEKGKVSEFDTNYMFMIGWYTESDLKSIIYTQQQLKKQADARNEKFVSRWKLKALQNLLAAGPQKKDDQNKSPEERLTGDVAGYFKIAHAFQVGIGGTFYSYAPSTKEIVQEWTNPDPRGVIPLHGLVPEEDYANPLGEPLAAISAGKQNLLDFDLQMYQYGQGMQYSPTLKKWGQTPTHKIKIIPDHVIEMNGNKNTDDVEVMRLENQAIANFANNYGLLKSQILSETGRQGDSSIAAASGNPGFSKTTAGVQQQNMHLSISDNDLRNSYELWQGRIYETLLNIHFAESRGEKVIDLEPDTMKRLKLTEPPKVDFDKDRGPIKFRITASTSQKLSDAEQVANMAQAEAMMTPQNVYYLGQKGWNLDIGEFQKQKLTRMGIDSIDKIMTKMTDQEAAEAKKQPFPIIDPPQFRITDQNLWPEAISAILAAGGVAAPAPASGSYLSAQGQADNQVEAIRAQAAMLTAKANAMEKQKQQPPAGPSDAETVLKAHEQALKQQELELRAEDQAHRHAKDNADIVLAADRQANDNALKIAGHAAARQDAENAREDAKEAQPEPAGAAR